MGTPDSSDRIIEHAERLAALEVQLQGIQTALGRMETKQTATLDAVDKLLAWRHRIDGAKHVVTVIVSGIAAFVVTWAQKHFFGSDAQH